MKPRRHVDAAARVDPTPRHVDAAGRVGADAVAALGAAVLVRPGCGRFRCHMKIRGVVTTLKAGDDDLLPSESDDDEEYAS